MAFKNETNKKVYDSTLREVTEKWRGNAKRVMKCSKTDCGGSCATP